MKTTPQVFTSSPDDDSADLRSLLINLHAVPKNNLKSNKDNAKCPFWTIRPLVVFFLNLKSDSHTNFVPTNNTNIKTYQFSSVTNSSIFPQEKLTDFVSEFNGQLIPLHPEHFLNEINDYFQFIEIPDSLKINIITVDW